MTDDTPPPFIDAGPLPAEVEVAAEPADQSPAVDAEVTDDTEDVLLEDEAS
jgi:hypothetical protein